MVTTRSSSIAPSSAAGPGPASGASSATDQALQLILERITALEQQTSQLASNNLVQQHETTPQATPRTTQPQQSNFSSAGELPSSLYPATTPFTIEEHLPNDLPISALAETSSDATIRSISQWFPSVKPEHVRAILRNEFIPTDLVKLISGPGTQGRKRKSGLILRSNTNTGAVELTDPETTEEEYHAWTFFQAWELYKGIFIWGAPASRRGQLASALAIYTHTLHRLQRSYSWSGAHAYHFAFHQFRVDDLSTLYEPESWRLVDTVLVNELCATATPSYLRLPPMSKPYTRSRYRYHPYIDSNPIPPASNAAPTSTPLTERIRFMPTNPTESNNGNSARRFPRLCDHYNSRPQGCTRQNCKFYHGCNICGKADHAAFDCTSAHASNQH
ncbi:hypothetical protein BJ508DRAFT_415595 [Ascobolus immersus RN42]|uniref:C3H1-type domain-containing protein n=1 Tax=Ascobolus immersus RN42 TaxID=1160509 RepID=A0A3N4IDX3_ASCIM|nr:hypothetical protein BJ508DRAFT_415595 [Ascobolus immersus RN42]